MDSSAPGQVIQKILDADISLVVSGGNTGTALNGDTVSLDTNTLLPAKWLKGSPKAFIAGAAGICGLIVEKGGRFRDANDIREHMTFAMGDKARVADSVKGNLGRSSGASPATARIAGLVAYLRGLNSPWAAQLASASG